MTRLLNQMFREKEEEEARGRRPPSDAISRKLGAVYESLPPESRDAIFMDAARAAMRRMYPQFVKCPACGRDLLEEEWREGSLGYYRKCRGCDFAERTKDSPEEREARRLKHAEAFQKREAERKAREEQEHKLHKENRKVDYFIRTHENCTVGDVVNGTGFAPEMVLQILKRLGYRTK